MCRSSVRRGCQARTGAWWWRKAHTTLTAKQPWDRGNCHWTASDTLSYVIWLLESRIVTASHDGPQLQPPEPQLPRFVEAERHPRVLRSLYEPDLLLAALGQRRLIVTPRALTA